MSSCLLVYWNSQSRSQDLPLWHTSTPWLPSGTFDAAQDRKSLQTFTWSSHPETSAGLIPCTAMQVSLHETPSPVLGPHSTLKVS
eukprot:UC4_evm1s191